MIFVLKFLSLKKQRINKVDGAPQVTTTVGFMLMQGNGQVLHLNQGHHMKMQNTFFVLLTSM